MNEIIISPSNPRIKELVKLRESPRRRRERGVFVVEGLDDLKALWESAGATVRGLPEVQQHYASGLVARRIYGMVFDHVRIV